MVALAAALAGCSGDECLADLSADCAPLYEPSFQNVFDQTLSYPADSGFAASLTLRVTGGELVSGQQTARAEAEAKAARQAAVASTLRDVRANATGVNVDNELQRMLLIEKSYAANANVVQTAARMLDELLTIV